MYLKYFSINFKNVEQHFLFNLLYACLCSQCFAYVRYVHSFDFLKLVKFRKIVLIRRRYQDLHIFTCYIAICEHTRVMMFVAGLWLSMQIGTGKGVPPRPTFSSYADTTRFSVHFTARKVERK